MHNLKQGCCIVHTCNPDPLHVSYVITHATPNRLIAPLIICCGPRLLSVTSLYLFYNLGPDAFLIGWIIRPRYFPQLPRCIFQSLGFSELLCKSSIYDLKHKNIPQMKEHEGSILFRETIEAAFAQGNPVQVHSSKERAAQTKGSPSF